jgi:hypothetical protein
VKRYNVLIYGADLCQLQYQMFNIFAAEHRCFMKDRVQTPWGASTLDRELSRHPSIQETLYKPVEIVIITKIDEHYFDNLLNEISIVNKAIKVLVMDPDGEKRTNEMIKKYSDVSISYCAVDVPESPEDLYFYDKPIKIESSIKQFWTDFFKFSLFNVEIT